MFKDNMGVFERVVSDPFFIPFALNDPENYGYGPLVTNPNILPRGIYVNHITLGGERDIINNMDINTFGVPIIDLGTRPARRRIDISIKDIYNINTYTSTDLSITVADQRNEFSGASRFPYIQVQGSNIENVFGDDSDPTITAEQQADKRLSFRGDAELGIENIIVRFTNEDTGKITGTVYSEIQSIIIDNEFGAPPNRECVDIVFSIREEDIDLFITGSTLLEFLVLVWQYEW